MLVVGNGEGIESREIRLVYHPWCSGRNRSNDTDQFHPGCVPWRDITGILDDQASWLDKDEEVVEGLKRGDYEGLEFKGISKRDR